MTDPGESIASTSIPVSVRAAVARWLDRWMVWLVRPRASRPAMMISTVAVSFVIFGFHAVQGILLARILGPAARGEYATAVFYTQSLIYIGLVGTLYSIARRAASQPKLAPRLGRSAVWLSIGTGLATMAAVALLSLSVLPGEKAYLAPLCIVCSLMLPWEHMRLTLLSVDHGCAQFNRYNANRIVHAVAFPAMLLVLWFSGAGSLHTVVLLSVTAPIVALVYRYLTARPEAAAVADGPQPRDLIREGMPFVLPDLSSNLFNRMDIFLILWLASLTVQGYYAAAVSAANLLVVAPNALALFTFNWGVRHAQALSWRFLGGICLSIAALQLVTALALAAVLAPLMMMVFGERFHGAVPFGLALLPAYAMSGCAAVAEGYLRGRNRARVEVWARLLGAAMIILVVLLTYDRWNEMSIPAAAFVGHAAVVTCLLAVIARDVRPRQFVPAKP